MVKVNIKGVKEYFEPKTGKIYRYHRKTGTRLFNEPGTIEFLEELEAAKNKLKPKPKPVPGTLGLVMKEYRASDWFTTLKPRTQQDYDKVIDYLSDMSSLVLKTLKPSDVVKIRDKTYQLRKRSFANYVLAVLSIIYEFAKERGYVEHNPVKGIRKVRKPKGSTKVNRRWTKEEYETVFNALPLHLLVPVAIARWTGLREGDVLKLPRTIYNGSTISYSTSKADVRVSMPIADPLRVILDKWMLHLQEHMNCEALTLCVNSRGRPWTESGFRSSFFKQINILVKNGQVKPGLTFHGLRHTVGTELRELGFDKRTIADMLGQKSESMAELYSEDADLSMKMKGVIQKLEIEHKKNKSV